MAVALAVAAVGGIIVATVPRGEREATVAFEDTGDAEVVVRIVIEDVDGTHGTMKVRLIAGPGTAEVPAEGYTVLTEIDGVEPIRVQPDTITSTQADGDLRFDEGNVSGYPFDRYAGSFAIVAVRGSPSTIEDVVAGQVVPVSITMIDGSSGYEVAARVEDPFAGTDPFFVDIVYDIDRSTPVVAWASIMMAIYWLLTATIVAVVLAVVLGYREWETRHLAWLAAMIFAFTSFRAAAPGSPPIGVYFDFASFFWAELLAALALAVLVVNYLMGRNIAGLEGPGVEPAEVPADP